MVSATWSEGVIVIICQVLSLVVNLLANFGCFYCDLVSVVQPSGPCWFCLASPEVEKHLVVSVGTQVFSVSMLLLLLLLLLLL